MKSLVLFFALSFCSQANAQDPVDKLLSVSNNPVIEEGVLNELEAMDPATLLEHPKRAEAVRTLWARVNTSHSETGIGPTQVNVATIQRLRFLTTLARIRETTHVLEKHIEIVTAARSELQASALDPLAALGGPSGYLELIRHLPTFVSTVNIVRVFEIILSQPQHAAGLEIVRKDPLIYLEVSAALGLVQDRLWREIPAGSARRLERQRAEVLDRISAAHRAFLDGVNPPHPFEVIHALASNPEIQMREFALKPILADPSKFVEIPSARAAINALWRYYYKGSLTLSMYARTSNRFVALATLAALGEPTDRIVAEMLVRVRQHSTVRDSDALPESWAEVLSALPNKDRIQAASDLVNCLRDVLEPRFALNIIDLLPGILTPSDLEALKATPDFESRVNTVVDWLTNHGLKEAASARDRLLAPKPASPPATVAPAALSEAPAENAPTKKEAPKKQIEKDRGKKPAAKQASRTKNVDGGSIIDELKGATLEKLVHLAKMLQTVGDREIVAPIEKALKNEALRRLKETRNESADLRATLEKVQQITSKAIGPCDRSLTQRGKR